MQEKVDQIGYLGKIEGSFRTGQRAAEYTRGVLWSFIAMIPQVTFVRAGLPPFSLAHEHKPCQAGSYQ